jgi:hypothetical protein
MRIVRRARQAYELQRREEREGEAGEKQGR